MGLLLLLLFEFDTRLVVVVVVVVAVVIYILLKESESLWMTLTDGWMDARTSLLNAGERALTHDDTEPLVVYLYQRQRAMVSA